LQVWRTSVSRGEQHIPGCENNTKTADVQSKVRARIRLEIPHLRSTAFFKHIFGIISQG